MGRRQSSPSAGAAFGAVGGAASAVAPEAENASVCGPISASPAVPLPVLVHPEPGGGYSVEVPALPGCHSQGATLEKAIANIREAAEGCLLVQHEMAMGGRATAEREVQAVISRAGGVAADDPATPGRP